MANPDFGEEHMELIAKKNKEAIDEMGWLRSGDKGTVSKEGMFKITGRYKELIIGSGGENIAPVPIENEIKKICPGISNIMMVGDKKKYNTAFVTLQADGATGDSPGTDNLDGLALDVVSGITTISAASQNPKYLRIIQDAITATNGNGAVCPSNASKIQKFTILPHDFSVETGELTPTLKLKRSAVMKAPEYQDILERLYAPGAGDYVAFNPKHQVEVGAATEPEKEAEAPVGPGADAAPLMEETGAASTDAKNNEGVDKV